MAQNKLVELRYQKMKLSTNRIYYQSTAPSSPSGNQRKFLYASRGIKTGSVDLPDEIDRSQSSASTSPCPSPVRQSQVSVGVLSYVALLFDQAIYFMPTLLFDYK